MTPGANYYGGVRVEVVPDDPAEALAAGFHHTVITALRETSGGVLYAPAANLFFMRPAMWDAIKARVDVFPADSQ